MSIANVGPTETAVNSGSDVDITLPTAGAVADDHIFVVAIVNKATSDMAISSADDTWLTAHSFEGSLYTCKVFYQVVGDPSNIDATANITSGLSGPDVWLAVSFILRGVETSTLLDGVVTENEEVNSATNVPAPVTNLTASSSVLTILAGEANTNNDSVSGDDTVVKYWSSNSGVHVTLSLAGSVGLQEPQAFTDMSVSADTVALSIPIKALVTANKGTSITNSNATEDAGNRYTVCMRSGFRVKPGTLVEDAYGALVRYESFDKRHPQELIRPLAENLTGPLRPEPTDTFIAASISPEDL